MPTGLIEIDGNYEQTANGRLLIEIGGTNSADYDHLVITNNATLDGNVTLTGAISERGTRHEDFSVVSANSDFSQVVVSGTSTITTASGTITTKFTGTIYFDNATFGSTHLAYIEGTESVTGGTGAYAGVAGKPGTFEATLDYVTGNVVGVFEAKVQLR